MAKRTNAEWLAGLRGETQSQALSDLRALLLRGLGFALRNHLNSHQHQILEDFVQEALLKILDNLDTFRGESQFTTWAQKIAVRVAFSEMRRKAWQDISLEDFQPQHEENMDFVPDILKDGSPSPEQQVNQHMLMETVQRLIAEELTERQRTAIVAVVMQGMPLEEVARRMDTNRNALYKLIHDARKRLQRSLLEQGMTPQELLAVFH